MVTGRRRLRQPDPPRSGRVRRAQIRLLPRRRRGGVAGKAERGATGSRQIGGIWRKAPRILRFWRDSL